MDDSQLDPIFAFKSQLDTCKDANEILQLENKGLLAGKLPENYLLSRKKELLQKLDTGLSRLRKLREGRIKRSPELKQLKKQVENRIMSLLLLSRENERMIRRLDEDSKRMALPARATVNQVRQAYMTQLKGLA